MKKQLLIFIALLIGLPTQAISIKYGPYLQNLDTNSVTITWITDSTSIGWVELAEDGSDSFYSTVRQQYHDTQDGIKNTSTIHSVTLNDLSPNTVYRYRVYSQAVLSHEGNRVMYGDYVATNVYSREPLRFKTNNHEKETMRFAMINDIHGDNQRMERLINHSSLMDPDMYIFNGDMASSFENEAQIFDDFAQTAITMFASEIPFYYVRGNHETRGTYASHFHQYFTTGHDKLYYTFRQGPVFFVMLDSGEDKPDSDIEYYGLVDYDNYRSEQAQWLSHIVTSEEYINAPIKVIVSHIPPTGDWHGNIEVKNKFMEVLKLSAPDLMLCGHEHELIYHEANESNPFPILINSHDNVVVGKVSATSLIIDIFDVNGTIIDTIILNK